MGVHERLYPYISGNSACCLIENGEIVEQFVDPAGRMSEKRASAFFKHVASQIDSGPFHLIGPVFIVLPQE